MDPQHLARLDDDGPVALHGTGRVGGSAAARTSPEGPEVPVRAPGPAFGRWFSRRRSTAVRASGGRPGTRRAAASGSGADVLDSDAWPLPVEPARLPLAGAPLPLGTAPGSGSRRVATARHRRPSTRNRRPAGYLAAALIGVAGVAVTVAGDQAHVAHAADVDQPVSVAEELGLVQSTISGDEAAERLRDMVASRAVREDAQAAAAQVQADADRVARQAAADTAAEAARPMAVLPVQGARLASGFGPRWGTLHAGVDFAAPLGTPEYAAMDGVVLRAGAASGFGLAVYIQHGNGDVTVYGHMQEVLVEEGQRVQAGDTIALLGNRGQSTGPHLHFEVHVGGLDGETTDPLSWLRERGVHI